MQKNTILQRIQHSTFFIKLFNWEYWPMYITNIPVVFYWLWFALKARKLFFFSAVNPAIETGGVLGESKINILNRIPEKYLPKTVFVELGTPIGEILKNIKEKGIVYPMIAKPNVGERGLLVSKIKSEKDLENYISINKVDFLIQEFVDLKMELAVMHHQFPGRLDGRVTSICVKDPLKVTGDGTSTVEELMAAYPRAILQLERFKKYFPDLLKEIPAKGELKELEPIGNHSRGTTFLNGNQYISTKMETVFNEIVAQMEGIQYGRFDMKCASPEAVENGDFRVLEYNGIAAEPAHIYDPSYPLLKKYRDIYQHWKIIYEIYKVQKQEGVEAMTWSEAKSSLKNYREYMKNLD